MKAILLLSDGIDSPVAGYIMGRQGVELVALHFVTHSNEQEQQVDKTVKIMRRLEETLDTSMSKMVIPYAGTLVTLSQECKRNLTCILCRRMMLRIADKIGGETGAAFIITGESLGQVASQTLTNLFVEEQASALPILRPLIGLDKVEITRIATEIGTYDISVSSNLCCDFAPHRPSTNSSLDEVLETELNIDVDSIVLEATRRVRMID
jgi:thiamine biosynthesis protein ThiI